MTCGSMTEPSNHKPQVNTDSIPQRMHERRYGIMGMLASLWLSIVAAGVGISNPAGAEVRADIRIQAAGAITSATIEEMEQILGLTFTPAERSQMLTLLTRG